MVITKPLDTISGYDKIKNEAMKSEPKKEKTYKISQARYIQMRRDEIAKRQIKRIVLELFDKVKNWEEGK